MNSFLVFVSLRVAIQLCCLNHQVNSYDPEKLFTQTRARDPSVLNNTKALEARGRINNYRKPLPPDVTELNGKVNNLKCGDAYAIANEGHLTFRLQSKSKPCTYDFLGSKTDKCTVAILCNGKVTLAPPVGKGCTQEWLVITDGTEGQMSGCGTFHFGNTARLPRNNGSDLYVFYKGEVTTATCVVFCIEDLRGKKNGNLKKSRQLSRNKKFAGLKYDDSCSCGKRRDQGRVVGGEDAFKFEFPWIAAVTLKRKGYERLPFCGASLVNDRYLITAAHCFAIDEVPADEIQVLFHAHVMDKRGSGGSKPQAIPGWDLAKETDASEQSLRLEVEDIQNHPLFDENTFDYDIAILKLKSKINFKKGKVGPVCLPEIVENIIYRNGEILTVAGWGKPDENAPAGSRTLQKLDVPATELLECQTYSPATSRHVCAGFTQGGKDACSGDSGGPLIHKFDKSNNKYMLAGVVSAGVGCARKDNLGLYTNVQELVQWVYHNTLDAVWCQK